LHASKIIELITKFSIIEKTIPQKSPLKKDNFDLIEFSFKKEIEKDYILTTTKEHTFILN
jgi:hypothetical protein